MKSKNYTAQILKLTVMTLVLSIPLSAQQQSTRQPKDAASWDAFSFLLGDWVGEGTGAPGEATGGFSFSFDLERKILVRRNRADYPATKDRPASSHTDLMVIYHGPDGQTVRAIYFDNEGHVIHYSVTMTPDQNSLTFLSDPLPSTPRFRFTYNKAKTDSMTFKFEIAPPEPLMK